MAFTSPHILRIREGTPTGTVLIPDLPSYLGSSTQEPKHHEPSETDENSLLAIGNTAMPGVDWFVIDHVRKRLVVKTPPDRDALCPSEWKLPETAITIDRGGIEFPDYAINANSKQSLSVDSNECMLKLSIIHGSATNPSFDIISIILEDTNDHAPNFPAAQLTSGDVMPVVIKVQESYGSNNAPNHVRADKSISQTKISLPMAKDPDQGINGIRGYRLEGQDAYHFRLEVGLPSEEQDNQNYVISQPKASLYRQTKSSQLWLVPVDTRSNGLVSATSGELDRELRAEYNVVLVAFDGGSPQRSARLPIRIVVEDVNDHAPVFNQPWYSGQISENDPPGYVIFEFSAQDEDSKEENGMIHFRIPGEIEHDPPSGTTSSRSDHKRKHLTGLSDSQIAAASFFAIEQRYEGSVDAKHFRAPMRDNNTYGRLIIRHLPKDQLRNAARQAISAAQRGPSLSSPKGLPTESYQTHDFKLSNNPRVGLRLEFVIEAYDHGKPFPLTARVPAYVNILDVNDHAPQIFVSYLQHAAVANSNTPFDNDKKPAWGRIKENLERAMIAQITVVDEDAELSEMDILCVSSDSRFALEDISSGRELIGDISNVWLLTSLNSKSITDHVGISTSSDTRARRHIIPTQMYKLMLTTPLDREASVNQPSRVEFAVTCTDNVGGRLPGGSLTSQIPVRVLIEDTNDNPPLFEQQHYTFHVPENHPSLSSRSSDISVKSDSYYVGQLKAVDADEGWFASVEYQLVSNPLSSLDLNTNTGQLYVIRPFDRETTNEVVFQVIAIDCKPTSDNGSASLTTEKRLSGTTEVRLVIDDLNDSPPSFEETNYQFEVEEGVDLARVGQVIAKDADQGEFARLSYRLAVGPVNRFSDSSMFGRSFVHKLPTGTSNQALDEALEINTHFQIDSSNGIIRLKGRLDRERRSHYEFIVFAVDNPRSAPLKLEGKYGGMHGELIQFTATATILVTVLDHNDNPPVILSPRNHAEFTLGPDQLIAGNTVFTIRANDPDLGENGTVEYQLIRVETDIGSGPVSDYSMSKNHKNLSTPAPAEEISHDATEYSPFAVDTTEGICYLRENLPPLDTEGPRAYLLRIRAYDLGRPLSLNTSLIVRVIRQPLGVTAFSALSEVHIERREQPIGGKLETHFLTEPTAGLDVKLSAWNGPSHTRISDRTMVIILSTVFVLLLLTTIVLLLLIRYRRLFLRNVALASSRSNESPLNKANMGYTAGKCFIPVAPKFA
ncbi:hypothetical protein PHET_01201 [Paragonimus heterotremus]|uniref:Cadherin domain-containing protein n=1 Tax=Paragonimus heterotremus TaxID=100268 RepID=A0A8J4WLG9_9TREM|nr:hypothetical protein PHET_01201 [Paragonimus heterotremus]